MSVSAPLAAIRAQHPLLHCISNIVSANDCANLALAIGASPIMAQAPRQIRKETISCQDVPSHDIKRTLIRRKRFCERLPM